MLAIQGLIFDLDGVITDTAEFHYQSWKQLGDEEGIPFTREDNHQLRGVSRRESLNRFLKGRSIGEATAQDWMARKNAYFQTHLQQLTPDHILPGVANILAEAHASGMNRAIGSASRNTRTVLSKLQIIDQFDAIGDGNSVVNTKPASDIFVWVAGALGLNPQQCLVFEDAQAGIEAALNGGFWTVGLGEADVHAAHLVLPSLDNVSLKTILEALAQKPQT